MKAKPKVSDITVTPVKKYAAPKYPTRADAYRSPTLLRRLPSRWEKNAAVVAAVGMLGAMSLTSCGVPTTSGTPIPAEFVAEQEYGEVESFVTDGEPAPATFTTEQEYIEVIPTTGETSPTVLTSEQEVIQETCDITYVSPEEMGELMGDITMVIPSEQNYVEQQETTNFLGAESVMPPPVAGGIGVSIPDTIYEQDALAIIKNMLESEQGFNFESDLYRHPNITNTEIKLYDFEKQIAIGYVGESFGATHKNYDGILMGRFNAPDLDYSNAEQKQIYDEYNTKLETLYNEYSEYEDEEKWNEYYEKINEITAEYAVKIKPFLEENVREQVRDFIEWLQGQGII